MKKAIGVGVVATLALLMSVNTASAQMMGGIMVMSANGGMVVNEVAAVANTGGNDADGSYAGHGGRGGDITNRGDDVDDSTTGNGGRGGNAGDGGLINTGNAIATAGADNDVNRNSTTINSCGCEGEGEGDHTMVKSRNRGAVLNGVMAAANTGDNWVGGSEAGNGGRGGDIDNKRGGDDVEDSDTGNGGAGGNGNVGGTVVTGAADSLAGSMTILNRNTTRIVR